MSDGMFVAGLLVLAALAFLAGQQRAFRMGMSLGGIRHLAALPFYYGMQAAVFTAVPALLLSLAWFVAGESIISDLVVRDLPDTLRNTPADQLPLLLNAVKNAAAGQAGDVSEDMRQAAALYVAVDQQATATVFGGLLALALCGFAFSVWRIRPALNARFTVEKYGRIFLLASACVAILTTIGIVLSVLFESLKFFHMVPVTDFLFGMEWSPQIAMRADQVGSSGSFGAVPLFAGTLLISAIAMVVAVPCGLMAAIYLSEYASKPLRTWLKPILELLAGIPTVVYGFFAALTVAPLVRDAGQHFGFAVSSESALVAGLVMGVMIIPFISSLSDDVINAVPQAMRDGSYGLGATQAETILQVVVPAALPGIVSGVLLAISRAIGETMIVVMAAGLSANLTANPFMSVTTVTAQIATLLVGDQEFNSPKTLVAFALGLVLFLVTLAFNIIALHIVKKYREQYE